MKQSSTTNNINESNGESNNIETNDSGYVQLTQEQRTSIMVCKILYILYIMHYVYVAALVLHELH